MLNIIKKMQIKSTMSYHLTPVRMAIINKLKSDGKNMKKREPLYTVAGNVNWCNHSGKQYKISQNIKNITTI